MQEKLNRQQGTGNEISAGPPTSNSPSFISDDQFRPRGAMAFLIVLMLIGAVIWFGVYYLMLQRA